MINNVTERNFLKNVEVMQGVKLIFFSDSHLDMVAKVKNLVALAPVLGAISRPVMKIK